MGVIQKQALRNTIFSYIGVVLGFLTAGVMMPHMLSPDENGLLKLLVSLSGLFATFANLGFNNVTTRYFPYFRNYDKKHHGFLFYSTFVSLLGFLLCWLIFYFIEPMLIARNIEKSKLLIDYLFYLLPLTFFTLYFNVFDVYARAVYSSVAGTFMKEFLQRVLIIASILLYYFNVVDFKMLVFLYVASLSIPTVLMALFLIYKKEWGIKPDFSVLEKGMVGNMVSLGLFTILIGLSSFTISNIDSIIINDKLGLGATGIYSIMFYFGALISVPARAIYRISSSVIADAMKNNDMNILYQVYYKSCINQFIIGAFLFLLVWCNIDTLLAFLPPEFAAGKYVVLFIGLGNIFEMATGVNNLIITNSKYYRYDTLFMFFLIGVTILTNLWLIPIYGITGSAIASAIAMLSFNAMRYLFILAKFNMQPFDTKMLKVAIVSGLAYAACHFIPTLPVVADVAVRSTVIALAFWVLLVNMKVSDDMYANIVKVFARFGINV